jgi:hypothetical protein
MKLILTTIGQGKVAIVQSAEKADERRGERYLSQSVVNMNVENGTFVDVSDKRWNPEGRLYILTEDM